MIVFRTQVSMLCLCLAAGIPGAYAATTADTNASNNDMEEVVITATKRDEVLKDVPLAVQVFTEKTLERANITRPADFIALSSNVGLMTAVRPGESDVSIRGIQGNFGLTQPVAIVVDGVVAADPTALDQELFGISQIEVVKGPQSALYGRNANAGAIIINTKRPSNDLEGKVVVGAGNGNSTKAQAMVSGAIVPDRLFARLSLSQTATDGYWNNPTVGHAADFHKERIIDGRVIYQATENLTFDLRLRNSKVKMGSNLWDIQLPPYQAFDNNNYFPEFQMNNNQPAWQDRLNAALKIDYQMPFATLTVIGAYNKMDSGYGSDGPINPLAFDPATFLAASPPMLPGYSYSTADGNQFTALHERDKTIEIRLTSPSKQRLRWMFGVYYADTKRSDLSESKVDKGVNIMEIFSPLTLDPYGINPTKTALASEDRIKDYAGFGQVQYDIVDDLELSLSLRWDEEDHSNTNLVPDIMAPASVAAGDPTPLTQFPGLVVSNKFKAWQPKVALRYRVTGNASLYGSYGRGFRSGGFNSAGSSALIRQLDDPNSNYSDAYASETTDAYELGFKSSWAEGRLIFNGAVFYSRIHNAQNFTAFPVSFATIVISEKKVRAQGFETELSYEIMKGLRITDNFGLTDTKIQEGDLITSIGNRVPLTPYYTNSLSLDYVQPIANDLDIVIHGDWNRLGKTWFDVYNTPDTQRNPINRFNARVALEGVRANGNGWSLSFWGKNILNKHYNDYEAPVGTFANFSYRAQPRTYGVDLSYKF